MPNVEFNYAYKSQVISLKTFVDTILTLQYIEYIRGRGAGGVSKLGGIVPLKLLKKFLQV